MNRAQYILSDADGTLVDTISLIRHGQFEVARAYLEKRNVPDEHIPDYDRYQAVLNAVVGGSARETLERTVRLLYQDTPEFLQGINYEELYDMLNPLQDRLAPSYVTAFSGLTKFLTWIGDGGRSLAILTSGTSHHVVRNFGIALPEIGLSKLYLRTDMSDQIGRASCRERV